MKRVLGLDLGTNSIGWALVLRDFEKQTGEILGIGSRIIPMDQKILGAFGAGQSISQTAERTDYRGTRRLYQRDTLRRERLHRVLNTLGFLPEHYANNIDFEKRLGQFTKETKLNYKESEEGNFDFLFMDSFREMVEDFKSNKPEFFHVKECGKEASIPFDWTIYFLRKKALEKKISKEEIAWILLNFNQKRGYYQLRGEEEEIQEDKTKEFEVLLVTRVEDSGEKLKGKDDILYDIYFENGWKYDKQTTKPENWLNKTKEFIVTTSTLKDGSIKRTYKAVDSEKDWIAIKKKTEKDIDRSNKTVGVFIYDTLLSNPKQKVRGKLVKTIERKFYKKELSSIISKQIELQPELFTNELYKACIEELYPRNEAHRGNIKDKGFEYLFLDDIIFYQRPLKSKKSTISGCQYEYRGYMTKDRETGEEVYKRQPLKVIPKSHPLFIEFRMWQFLSNLKIYQKQDKSNVDITSKCLLDNEEWCDLFDFLMDKKEVEQKNVIDYFVKIGRLDKNLKDEYRWNYQENKKLPMNPTRAQFTTRLSKVLNFDLAKNTIDFQTQLWHIVYSVKDKNEFISALGTFADKNSIDKDSFVERFKSFPPYSSEYGSYSQKAIKKLLPLMRMGRYWNIEDISDEVIERVNDIKSRLESIKYNKDVFGQDLEGLLPTIADDVVPKQLLKSFIDYDGKNHFEGLNTYQACYAVYERHSEVSEITKWRTPEDIDNYLSEFKQHSLRNPIVEQVVTETLRTVRDIWTFYGDDAEDYFSTIHVEIGRDMKNSADKRKSITNKNAEKERTNYRIKELLKELKTEITGVDIRPYSPSHQEILKIYEEGVVQNPEVDYSKVGEEEIFKIRKNNSPSKKEIERYKLWLEQGYISPYTGRIIPLSDLFTEAYQIEHIIPQSRYFDDSLFNKVICESAVNQEKSNQTAYAYLKEKGGSVVELGNGKNVTLLTLDKYESHCGRYFKKNRTKLMNLLSEDIPEGFINRQMNDSRYISKVVKTLLSNIVREKDEKEATSKNLLPVPGKVTSKLKHDWGLNDKWNELIAPRFKRLNKITGTNDYGYWDEKINAFRIQVPDEVAKENFSKKRIDHRHHALDALVIACTTRNHTHYLHSLNAEKENHALRSKLLTLSKEGHFTKYFLHPWETFTVDAKNELEKIVISFKQNLRVINKTSNKTWKWVKQSNGKFKKELVKQTKGDNWAIRKPLHKKTASGGVRIKKIKKGESKLSTFLGSPELIFDKKIREKVKSLHKLYDSDIKKIKKHVKSSPILINGKEVDKIKVYEWTKNASATRTPLTEKFTRKQLNSITDSSIRSILNKHVANYIDDKGKENFSEAFSTEGVDSLNKNIKLLNGGKNHQPIYKVRVYEEGSKFAVSENDNSPKSKKLVEAAKGTNLFFAVYWDEAKQKRNYDTVPLNEVIAHQKNVAHLSKNERTSIQPKPELGEFMFTLSPNDLVYVPSQEEIDNPNKVDFEKLSDQQVKRVYKMVSCTDRECHFIPMNVSTEIVKNENGTNSKSERIQLIHLEEVDEKGKGLMIKSICWKLKIDRLGNISKI